MGRVSGLQTIEAGDVDDADLFYIVDVSEVDPADQSKAITKEEMAILFNSSDLDPVFDSVTIAESLLIAPDYLNPEPDDYVTLDPFNGLLIQYLDGLVYRQAIIWPSGFGLYADDNEFTITMDALANATMQGMGDFFAEFNSGNMYLDATEIYILGRDVIDLSTDPGGMISFQGLEITIGAADSGGAGFRLLRVPN